MLICALHADLFQRDAIRELCNGHAQQPGSQGFFRLTLAFTLEAERFTESVHKNYDSSCLVQLSTLHRYNGRLRSVAT